MPETEEPETRSPYSRLAEIYDHVMRHVDYEHWADYVESITVRHHLVPNRVVDLACGTGSLALELASRGYRMTGADGCAEMAGKGAEKARARYLDLDFHHRDLCDLEGLGSFDWALCLYDSMNYMMSLDQVANALSSVHAILEPGGLFVFDVCTETNSVRYFRDMRESDRGRGFSYTRHSYYEDGIQHNDFEIKFGKSGEVVRECHTQRIYPLADIESTVRSSPFRLEATYSGFGFEAPTENSDRVHFVLRA